MDEHALDLKALDGNNLLRESLFDGNDATWLRARREPGLPLSTVVEAATQRWMS